MPLPPSQYYKPFSYIYIIYYNIHTCTSLGRFTRLYDDYAVYIRRACLYENLLVWQTAETSFPIYGVYKLRAVKMLHQVMCTKKSMVFFEKKNIVYMFCLTACPFSPRYHTLLFIYFFYIKIFGVNVKHIKLNGRV